MPCISVGNGLNKIVAYKIEDVCWGDLPSLATGAKQIRRVSANFNLTKETYQSEEIRSDYQMVDFRHGVRTTEGNISGELSPGTYQDFQAAALARDFTAITPSALGSTTITAVSVGYTIARTTGSWLTDGVRVGMVIRLAGFNTNNNAKNLLVIGIASATTLTAVTLNGSTLTPETVASGGTYTSQGKSTYVPSTGHTDKSFTFEEFYDDIDQSEVYTGNKVNTMSIALPATGLVTTEIAFMGKDLKQTGTVQYFTSPTAAGTSAVFASVSGALIVQGVPVALITSANININRNLTGEAVVGSNTKSDLEVGRVLVDGDFSTLFADGVFRDYFKDETEVSLVVALTTSSLAASDFFVVTLPRIKIGSATKEDGEKSIVSQHSFQALKGTGTGNFEATTIQIQDSMAV